MDELRIIKYLDGELSADELRDFEEEIRMNPPLAEEVARFRQIQELAGKLLSDQGIENEELDPLVQKEISDAVKDYKKDPAAFGDVPEAYLHNLKQAGQSFSDNRGKTSSIGMINRIWYTAAAIVVLAILASILVFKPFAGKSPNEIYAQYFSTFHKTNEILELARNDNDFLFAIEVYEAGDYDRAAVLFEMLADSTRLRAWSLLYAGSSYMSLNQITKAMELFHLILQEGDDEVVPAARWQLALCHLRAGEPELAVEQLEILSSNPVYRRDAGRILRLIR